MIKSYLMIGLDIACATCWSTFDAMPTEGTHTFTHSLFAGRGAARQSRNEQEIVCAYIHQSKVKINVYMY